MSTLTAAVAVPRAGSGLLAATAPDLQTHLAVHGPVPVLNSSNVLAELERSGLTGRGGAGFPAAVKVRAVAAASSGRAVVVGNGAEGEPASSKDRHLLTLAPHLVLDGLQLAGLAVGAARLYLYVRSAVAGGLRYALAEREGLDRLPVEVVEAAPGFVSGQETAVVSRLNAGPALPQFSRHRVTVRGVGGRPTLVQNVETLAHLAMIARHGGEWFASTGVPGSTGSFLATVHSVSGSRPATSGSAVWDVPHGTTLRNLLDRSAGVPLPELEAVLIGGYHGSWLRLPAALDLPLSRDGLSPFGASVGAGVIMPIASSTCGLEVSAQIVCYLAQELARQCGPCQFGLPQLAGLMSSLAAGTASSADLLALRATAGLVTGRGACNHPDGTVRMVRSALAAFERDVVLHGHGRCLARIGSRDGGVL